MSNYQIYKDVKDLKENYEGGSVSILDGLYFSQYQTLRMCEFYANSKYLNGQKDKVTGKIRPFYNVVNYRVTIAKVATDLDIKDIQITSDDPEHYVESMLLNKEAYEWMKKVNFSLVLNKMGYKRPKYGGVILKTTEDKKEGLRVDVLEWKNVFTDQVDIENNPIVERHYMTPKELRAKKGVWNDDEIENAIDVVVKAKKKDKNGYGNRIEVYEVHGQFPVSYLKEFNGEEASEEDESTYSQQRYFIGEVNNKCFYFYADEEKESPYDYLSWEEMEGRALGRGIIEDAEESQVWTNESIVNEWKAMELAGRVAMKTTSKKLANNVLEVDNGKIFELGPNETLDPINFSPTALGEYQNQIQRWKEQGDLSTSSFDANTGEQPPSGTPLGTVQLLNAVASKPFDYRREEAGIFITRLFEKRIIPYLIKKIYKEHIFVTDYSQEELEFIDNRIAKKMAVERAMDDLFNLKVHDQTMIDQNVADIKSQLSNQKSRRYIDIPEGFFDGIQAKVTVVTTGEQRNKAATLQSLSTILQTVQASFNPNTGSFGILENPTLNKIFGTILEMSGAGISPVSFGLSGQVKQGGTQPQQPIPQATQLATA